MLWSYEGCIYIKNLRELRSISIICLMRGLSLEGIVVIWLLSLQAKATSHLLQRDDCKTKKRTLSTALQTKTPHKQWELNKQ